MKNLEPVALPLLMTKEAVSFSRMLFLIDTDLEGSVLLNSGCEGGLELSTKDQLSPLLHSGEVIHAILAP